MSYKHKRRWYQFSLKAMLLVITLLCIGPGGYVAYEQNKALRQRAAIESLEVYGGLIIYDDTIPRRGRVLRLILGDDRFNTVKVIDVGYTAAGLTDAGLEDIRLFSHLRELDLSFTEVTDATLDKLAGLEELHYLELENTKVTAAGARRLREKLPRVRIVLSPLDYWP